MPIPFYMDRSYRAAVDLKPLGYYRPALNLGSFSNRKT
jgi:hypothetical protein